MTNRRADAVYFVLLLVVALVGFQLSGWWTDDYVPPADPTFRPPPLELPEQSIDLPEPFFAFRYRSAGRFATPGVSSVPFVDEMEMALEEVREALLDESEASEVVQRPEQLAAVVEP